MLSVNLLLSKDLELAEGIYAEAAYDLYFFTSVIINIRMAYVSTEQKSRHIQKDKD